MIIVMRHDATPKQIAEVVTRVEGRGLRVNISRGEEEMARLTGLTQLVLPARYLDKLVQRGERAHGGSLYTAQTSSTGTSLSARESGTQPQRADNIGERIGGVAADERVDVRQCRRHPTGERSEAGRRDSRVCPDDPMRMPA